MGNRIQSLHHTLPHIYLLQTFIHSLAALRLIRAKAGGATWARPDLHSNSRLINVIANGTCHLRWGELASQYLSWQVPGVTYKSESDGYVSNN